MIIIPFVPGAFGSTIEYLLRSFTKEYKETRIIAPVLADGSMHSYKKMSHIVTSDVLKEGILSASDTDEILTPIYPFTDLHADETIQVIIESVQPADSIIFIYINDIKYAELNMLCQYHKISIGYNKGLDIFCRFNADNIIDWNKNYSHWSEMENWELREWLSIFYVQMISEWTSASKYMTIANKISSESILTNTYQVFKDIIGYCNLTLDREDELAAFTIEWKLKQQYILDEYALINKIIECTINNTEFSWDKLNIIAESIIQQNIRARGFEIKCWMLNEFPTNSQTLHSLLERI